VRVDVTQADGARDPAWRSDVTLVVPSTARLDPVRIDDGRLDLSRVRGAIRATVATGAIEATDVAGTLRLETTRGNIVVSRAQLTGDGPIRLRAFNGDLTLRFSAPLTDARVHGTGPERHDQVVGAALAERRMGAAVGRDIDREGDSCRVGRRRDGRDHDRRAVRRGRQRFSFFCAS
jgi:hypothetical protein